MPLLARNPEDAIITKDIDYNVSQRNLNFRLTWTEKAHLFRAALQASDSNTTEVSF